MNPDRTSTIPLYIQIREEIRQDITSGSLKAGERLPPVTALATKKGVTAATIRRALQDLINDDLVSSHVGRGTFVCEQKNISFAVNHDYAQSNRLRQTVTRNLTEMMSLAQKPGVISFTRGTGATEIIEKGILQRLTQQALSDGEELFWDYGDPRGLLSLRKAIARLYLEQGVSITPEQVLITSGSQQALSIIAQQTAESGNTFICETPCYTGVTNAFSVFGAQIKTVQRDSDGPILSQLPNRQNTENPLFYVCPVLHNPMGTDISKEKQQEVVLWARKNCATILSDEVFRDLHTGETQPPSFLQELGPEQAIILGSLSKSFISGLRVGWIITSEERIRSLTHIKKATDLGCPPLMQGIARAFLEDEQGFYAHRNRIRAYYNNLRDTTLEALVKYMPENVVWTKPQGGFQLWVTLPIGYSSIELFLRCVEMGVAFLPGPLQDIDNRFTNSFRLCYGSLTVIEINNGIKRLGTAVKQYLNESPGESGRTGLGDF